MKVRDANVKHAHVRRPVSYTTTLQLPVTAYGQHGAEPRRARAASRMESPGRVYWADIATLPRLWLMQNLVEELTMELTRWKWPVRGLVTRYSLLV